MIPVKLQDLVWSPESDGVWTACNASGSAFGIVTRTGRYSVLSADGSVAGSHGSLDAAKSELEAFARWIFRGTPA